MQPSEYEIQREVEALRDLKRRSATPGALALDPDLPNASSGSPTTSSYWSGDGDSSSNSHEDSSSSENTSVSGGGDGGSQPSDDPFHLFWVPASVHPEIAPAEFRAFLKEHARSPSSPDGGPSRSSSLSSSSSLGRKRSMLSRQYRPSEHDGVGDEEETIVPLRRSRSRMYPEQGPQLTISDLQRLEELAEEASQSDDPSQLRNILRRSLSVNLSFGASESAEAEADVPIIVPPPNQILRRANRTKIRKPGLPGDGGGHRFSSTRRGASARAGTGPVTLAEKRASDERSSSDHGDEPHTALPTRRQTLDTHERPDSYSEETSIFDAYVHEDDDEHVSVVVTASPPQAASLELPHIQADTQTSLFDALEPVLYHPQPQRLLSTEPQQQPSRTPSPAESAASPPRSPEPSQPPPIAQPSPPTQTSPQPQRKDKDKKGLFGKWGADKGTKKGTKEKERETRERAEKESGFFGSLFGGKKNKESDGASIGGHGVAAGREAAAALLGSSKSAKNYVPPPSPIGSPGVNNWSRYPIHVERAIYRLSHIKLANPRRPLYEQVLISNLMFWYLGVINKAQTPTPTTPTSAGDATQQQQENEPNEEELRERELQEKAEKERLEQEQKEKEMIESKKKEPSPRRGPLTKPAAANAGGRRAEMPVKGPQYDLQHRVMEEEYGYGSYNATSSSPQRPTPTPANASSGQPYHQQPVVYQQSTQDINGYYSSDPQSYRPVQASPYQQPVQQQRLPPGAMQPQAAEPSGWPSQGNQQPRQSSKSPPPASNSPRRSRSPPQQGFNAYNSADAPIKGQGAGGRVPSRSLSATAVSPAPVPSNGKLRKGHSAYAGTTSHSSNANGRRPRADESAEEDEDVPLAVWQQQQATNKWR